MEPQNVPDMPGSVFRVRPHVCPPPFAGKGSQWAQEEAAKRAEAAMSVEAS